MVRKRRIKMFFACQKFRNNDNPMIFKNAKRLHDRNEKDFWDAAKPFFKSLSASIIIDGYGTLQ